MALLFSRYASLEDIFCEGSSSRYVASFPQIELSVKPKAPHVQLELGNCSLIFCVSWRISPEFKWLFLTQNILCPCWLPGWPYSACHTHVDMYSFPPSQVLSRVQASCALVRTRVRASFLGPPSWFVPPPPGSLRSFLSIPSALNQSCLVLIHLCQHTEGLREFLLNTYHLADIVLRHFTCIILFNPNVIP